FNFGGCHESGIASKEKYEKVTENLKPGQRQEAASLDLPPYYPDTPAVREDWKRNYELITALDEWVGEHLRALEEAGLADTTIVMFWSDHGVGLPRAKRWLYDSGTHVPLIVYVPPAFQDLRAHTPAGECQDLISSIDFGPTVLSLAGLPVPKVMQGRPFLGKQPGAKRKYVFGARDRMDERYDIIRSVRDRRYRYIRNYEPLKPYYQYMNTPEKGMTMQEIRRVGRDGRLPAGALAFMGEGKPVEELYDLEKDPHEIRNLATDPDHRERLERMRQVQQDWSRRTRDLGLVPESQIAAAEGVAGSRFALLREGSSEDLLQRLVRVAARASEGPEALGDLRRASGDTSPAVRYWAATGMGHYPDDLGAGDHQLLLFLVEDDDPAVRVAAARALASIVAFHPRALTLLEKELSSEEEWVRLQAAIVLDEMGERARPSLTALQRCLKGQPNKYITRVANHAVNALLGTNHRVR
ncbi:MAG: sulfatase/phosphatase domain-containing protein, partial [Verrucomicrobiota bacterium]